MTDTITWALPANWEEVQLSDLISPEGIFSDGDWIESKDQDPEGEVRLVQLADIGEMQFLDKSRRYLTEQKAHNLKCTFLRKEDVLISRLGDPLGKACMYPGNEPLAVTAVDVCILRPGNSHVEPRLIGYFLNSPQIRQSIDRQSSGTTRKRITGKKLKALPFRLPPLNEQHRIVEKIETLFARIDKGEEALREVQKLLRRYRQSILKAAVTGELTRDWREANQHKLEPASDLLARILEARRENWQGRGNYKVPLEPNGGGLPSIPKGWTWVTLDQLAEKVEYGSSAKCSTEDPGVPVLRMGNIIDGAISYENLKYLPEDHKDFPNLLIEDGDLLFNRTNSAELVGKTAVVRNLPSQCSFASYLIRVKLIDVVPELISAYINSVFGRQWIKSVVSQQVGQANVNGSKLKALTVPLPPKQEQEEIAFRLGTSESNILQLLQAAKLELGRSSQLRQSILKSAFTGQLVPQDPNDEPASELLARIRAEREATPKKRSKKKSRIA